MWALARNFRSATAPPSTSPARLSDVVKPYNAPAVIEPLVEHEPALGSAERFLRFEPVERSLFY